MEFLYGLAYYGGQAAGYASTAAPYIAAGTAVAAADQQGRQANTAAKFQSREAQAQANEEAGAGQRRALIERRKAERVISRANALAAASGAGAKDATVIDITNDLEAQGEFNALSALYTGTSRANALDTHASAYRSSGRYARSQSRLAAVGTLMDSASTLYTRYGMDEED